jgi:membrane protease YdiL (CAAX protease family)
MSITRSQHDESGVSTPHGPAWAIIAATAAAFAGIHGFLVVMLYVLVFGIVTGWLRERTGSVAAGFVAHVLNNAMLVTLTLLLTG